MLEAIDTVPANGNAVPRPKRDTLHGLGTADMKGGLAAMLRLADQLGVGHTPRFDITLVWYEAEEVADAHNGLRRLFGEAAHLVAGDFAILLEPTGGWVEAGCQGSLTMRAIFRGARAHTARPWMGVNAVHKAAPALERIAAHVSDNPVVDGLEFREALQVVRVEAGVANNVVPDECTVVVNRRVGPNLTLDEAEAQVRLLLDGADDVDVLSGSLPAAPNLSNALVAEFVGSLDLAVRPKLGWTDVARFVSNGIPAINFGPGDPTLAHTAAGARRARRRRGLPPCAGAFPRSVGGAAAAVNSLAQGGRSRRAVVARDRRSPARTGNRCGTTRATRARTVSRWPAPGTRRGGAAA